MAAYDRNSVLGDKPASGTGVQESDPRSEADSDMIDVVPKTDVGGNTETVTKKTAGREAGLDPVSDKSGCVIKSVDQCLLLGKAGKLIRDALFI